MSGLSHYPHKSHSIDLLDAHAVLMFTMTVPNTPCCSVSGAGSRRQVPLAEHGLVLGCDPERAPCSVRHMLYGGRIPLRLRVRIQQAVSSAGGAVIFNTAANARPRSDAKRLAKVARHDDAAAKQAQRSQ